jgi:molybdate transport system regulatory protein
MTMHPTSDRLSHRRLIPRIKVWLKAEGRYVFGFGIAEILRAVDRAGSIKQAADDLGKSYRYVWGRVKDAEEALGQRLVETKVGGQGVQRSALTPEARRLARTFLKVRDTMLRAVEQAFRRQFERPSRPRRREA